MNRVVKNCTWFSIAIFFIGCIQGKKNHTNDVASLTKQEEDCIEKKIQALARKKLGSDFKKFYKRKEAKIDENQTEVFFENLRPNTFATELGIVVKKDECEIIKYTVYK